MSAEERVESDYDSVDKRIVSVLDEGQTELMTVYGHGCLSPESPVTRLGFNISTYCGTKELYELARSAYDEFDFGEIEHLVIKDGHTRYEADPEAVNEEHSEELPGYNQLISSDFVTQEKIEGLGSFFRDIIEEEFGEKQVPNNTDELWMPDSNTDIGETQNEIPAKRSNSVDITGDRVHFYNYDIEDDVIEMNIPVEQEHEGEVQQDSIEFWLNHIGASSDVRELVYEHFEDENTVEPTFLEE